MLSAIHPSDGIVEDWGSGILKMSTITTHPTVNPSLRGAMTGKARKLMSEQREVAMVNHCAVVHVLRLVSLLSLSIFKQVSNRKPLVHFFCPQF